MSTFRSVGSLEEALKIATGESNAEQPHVTAPVFMPLALPMNRSEGLSCLRPNLRAKVEKGDMVMVAVCHGTIGEEGEDREPLQGILLHGRLDSRPDELPGYWVFWTPDDGVEEAVLMDGHGRRYLGAEPLSREEAIGQWIAGFLNWNCERPGLYRLRYAFIQA